MIRINRQNFDQRTLLPATEEFPEGFGIELTPAKKGYLDLDKWFRKDIEEIVTATRKWGALVIRQIDLEAEHARELKEGWSEISGTKPANFWHSDGYLVDEEGARLRAVMLAHGNRKKLRKLPTMAIPTSTLDRELEKMAGRYLKKDIDRRFDPWFKEIALNKAPYVRGERYLKLVEQADKHLQMGISRMEKESFLGNLFIDVNARNAKKLLAHDWAKNPRTALVVNSDDEQSTGIAPVLHACLTRTNWQTDTEAPLWHCDIFN